MGKLKINTMLIMLFPSYCFALDGAPGDYKWAGDGTSSLLVYGEYQSSNTFKIDGAGKIADSKLNNWIGILRGVHYAEIAGWKTAYQVVVPMADIATAKIGGVDQNTNSGIGDVTVGATLYPVVSPGPTGTTLAITAYLTAPVGDFDTEKVNVGSGSWILTPQIGLIQGLGNGFNFGAIADVALYASKRHNGVKKSVDPSYQIQLDFSYDLTQATSLSLGYSRKSGGEEYLDNNYSGINNRSEQVRLFATHWIAPTLQAQLMVGKDIYSESGFKNDSVTQIRLLKVF